MAMNEIKRGDVYYVYKNEETIGSEQKSGRPAVIVSNNKNNKHSTIVEIVYCTTKPKAPLPTHVVINTTPSVSFALCEQVTSISVDRLSNFIGCCTADEIKQIDKAIAISLGLKKEEPEKVTENTLKTEPSAPEYGAEVLKLQIERDMYKTMYEELLHKLLPNNSN